MFSRIMTSALLLGVLAAFVLGGTPANAAEQETPISGAISDVQPALRQLSLEGLPFHVPQGVGGFDELILGDLVVLYYRKEASTSVVERIEILPPR